MPTHKRWLRMKEQMENDPQFYNKYLRWVRNNSLRNAKRRESDPKSWYAYRREWFKGYYQKKR